METKIKQTEEKSINPKKKDLENASLSVEKSDITNKDDKNKTKTVKKSHEIKDKAVKKIIDRIKNSKTLMIVSIKSLPSPQFQSIKKGLREHAKIEVAKKNILIRAIKGLKKESVLSLEKHIQDNCAFVISDLDGFELAGLLAKNKNPVFAKAGQIASDDIGVKAGPTNLAPGPAISELGALGIQIAVEDGKISIKQPRVVVKKTEKITTAIASLLQKLDIKPFTIGLEPIALYDIKTEKIYTDIKIDSVKVSEDLKIAAGKSLGFAQKIVYYCKETIGYLLAKSNAQANKIKSLNPKVESSSEQPTTDTKTEEKSVEEKTEQAENQLNNSEKENE